MGAVAIIPARGGSVRVPRKNVAEICGRPAIVWPIEACFSSGMFERVIVSTEDADIANIAHDAGAEVDERPVGLADHRTKVREVIEELLGRTLTEFACIVYPTAVFISGGVLAEAFAEFEREPVPDFVLGVTAVSPHPWKALNMVGGYGRPVFPEKIDLKGQQQIPYYAPSGTFHWVRRETFLAGGAYWEQRRRLFVLSRLESLDIDEPEDLELVRLLKQLELTRRAKGP